MSKSVYWEMSDNQVQQRCVGGVSVLQQLRHWCLENISLINRRTNRHCGRHSEMSRVWPADNNHKKTRLTTTMESITEPNSPYC